jgi:hypothetical protein
VITWTSTKRAESGSISLAATAALPTAITASSSAYAETPQSSTVNAIAILYICCHRSLYADSDPRYVFAPFDYLNGDFYVNFGVAIGLLPHGCTKDIAEDEYPGIRDKLKVACLAMIYGMGPALLAVRIEKAKGDRSCLDQEASPAIQSVLGLHSTRCRSFYARRLVGDGAWMAPAST